MQATTALQNIVSLLGRIALSQIFILAGWDKIYTLEETAKQIEALGLPMGHTFAIIAVIMSLGGGFLVLLGWRTRFGAFLLLLLTIVLTYYLYPLWTMEPDAMKTALELFMKNLAILGGILYIMAFGAGGLSIDGRRPKRIKKETDDA